MLEDDRLPLLPKEVVFIAATVIISVVFSRTSKMVEKWIEEHSRVVVEQKPALRPLSKAMLAGGL
jgi:hypothetical protein